MIEAFAAVSPPARRAWPARAIAGLILAMLLTPLPGLARDGGGGGNDYIRQSPCLAYPASPGCPYSGVADSPAAQASDAAPSRRDRPRRR